MATAGVRRRTHEVVEQLCATTTDAAELRRSAVELLRPVLAFSNHVWVLTDPVTTVGCAPHADVPDLRVLPEMIRAKYLSTLNRWTSLGTSSSGLALLAREVATDEVRGVAWRELLGRYDVVDVASVVHRDGYGTWGFLDLWRTRDQGPFDEDDAAFLAGLAGPLTSGLRSCQAAMLSQTPRVREARGPVVVLVDEELRVVGDTETALAWLGKLLPADPGHSPIPAVVYNVAGQLLAIEAGVDQHPATARVHLSSGTWVTARAARVRDRTEAAPGSIAVTLEETSATDRLEVYVRAHALSPREQQLVGLLAGGMDTREAADVMSLSSYTIQDHLKAVFAKTGVNNRRTLLARGLGGSSQA